MNNNNNNNKNKIELQRNSVEKTMVVPAGIEPAAFCV